MPARGIDTDGVRAGGRGRRLLPVHQRKNGYDAGAKSDVRNAATAEESVYTDTQAHVYSVGTADPVLTGWKKSGHTTGVVVTDNSATAGTGQSYKIKATSESGKIFCWDSTGTGGTGVYSATAGAC